MEFLRKPTAYLIFAVFTCLFSLISIQKRVTIEKSNTKTAIVADIDTIHSLSASQGLTIEEGVAKLQSKGLNGVVIPEQTIEDLLNDGKAVISGVSMQGSVQANSLVFSDTETVQRVVQALQMRFGKLVQTTVTRDNRLPLPPVSVTALKETPIGLDPMQVDFAKRNNLLIVGRYSNPPGTNAVSITQTIENAGKQGVSVFLAQGEQVLGRRDALDVTIAALEKAKMLYASPEFAKLGGDEEMLKKIPERVVRLHSAQAAELDKLSLDGAIERYRKAAKERNMRILLLRSISSASPSPLDTFGEFVNSVREIITKEKLSVGAPEPFTEPGVSKIIKILIGISGGLAGLWVAYGLFPNRNGLILGVIGALAIIAGAATNGKGLQISALLLSLVFPIGAFLLFFELKMSHWIASLVMPIFAMIGGLCVAGLLNGIDFYIRAETFPGVKIAVFLPIFIIGIFAFAKLSNFKESMKEPITWGAAALGLAIVGTLLFMMMRTGNDNPNAVSGGEIAFRDLLESILPVRPRSKEFLLGFPALFVGLAILAHANYEPKSLGKMAGWVALLLMLGAIGLTDVVNTLCHLHTPVETSLLRNVLGIVLGYLIGIAIWLPLQVLVKKHLKPLEVENS